MLDINVVAIGKIKTKSIALATDEYIKRLKPYARINLVELPPIAFTESTRAKAKITESSRIADVLAKFKSNQSHIWLLAENGKEFDSFGFADFLNKDTRPLVLAVAGSLGWSDTILKQYRNHLSLSKLTMPHELARLVLFEQLYRATAITAGKTYHY